MESKPPAPATDLELPPLAAASRRPAHAALADAADAATAADAAEHATPESVIIDAPVEPPEPVQLSEPDDT